MEVMNMQASIFLLVHIFLFCTLVIVTVLYSDEKHEKTIKGFYFASLKSVFITESIHLSVYLAHNALISKLLGKKSLFFCKICVIK